MVMFIFVKYVIKENIPCQAVANKFHVVELPKPFQRVSRREGLLLPRRVLFKKLLVMAKVKLLKIKVSICPGLQNTRPCMSHLKAKIMRSGFRNNSAK